MTHGSFDNECAVTHSRRFEAVFCDGTQQARDRTVAIEEPIAVEIDGFAYAVLMASPSQLEDLAIGFALGERLIDSVADVVETDLHRSPAGTIVRLSIADRIRGRIGDRIRHRTTDSACGLCGVETLEQAMRPLPTISPPFAGEAQAVFRALEQLNDFQPLHHATGAVHAAALCAIDGTIRMVREDVGRHNALDKLIGAMARGNIEWKGGFALMTSRCSYELVEKAALAGCPMLATISAPTALALSRAAEAGLPIVSLARRDSYLRAR